MELEIKGLDSLTREQAEEILYRIFNNVELEFIKFQLKLRNIKKKTRIYKAFQHRYYYNKNVLKLDGKVRSLLEPSPEQENDKRECVKIVLDQSDFKDWIEAYSELVPIKYLVMKIAPFMNNRLEFVTTLEE